MLRHQIRVSFYLPENQTVHWIFDWENWSLPIGNSYMGACIFGRTDTERLQITDKTLYIKRTMGSRNTDFICRFIY